MAQGNNAATQAYQKEAMVGDLPLLFETEAKFYARIKKHTEVTEVSSRYYRAPARLLASGKVSQINPDFGNLPNGGITQSDYFSGTPVYLVFPTQYSKQVEVATDSKEKAEDNAVAMEVALRAKVDASLLDAIIAGGDGSGALDTIVALDGTRTIITFTNANQFMDDQDLVWFVAAGQPSSGNSTVLSVDALNKQVTFTAPLPAGVTTGYIAAISGSSGVAGSFIQSIRSLNNNPGNTGLYLNRARSAYPGKLITPYVNFNSGPLTPQKVRQMLNFARRAMGTDATMENFLWHSNLDMEAAWENNGIIVSSIIQNQLKGDESQDMLKHKAPSTIAGHELLVNLHALPGRLDGIDMTDWFRVETQPYGNLDFGEQKEFPIPSGNSYQAGTIRWNWIAANIGNLNPRRGCYGDNIAMPSGY